MNSNKCECCDQLFVVFSDQMIDFADPIMDFINFAMWMLRSTIFIGRFVVSSEQMIDFAGQIMDFINLADQIVVFVNFVM